MNILIVTPIFPPEIGGPASYTKSLAQHLSRNHRVTIITFSPQSPRRIPNVNIVPISLAGGPFARQRRLYQAVRKNASTADVVYVQGTLTVGLASLVAAKRNGKPIIIKFVGDEYWEARRQKGQTQSDMDTFYSYPQKSLLLWLHRWILTKAQAVITPSQYLKDFLINTHHQNPSHIQVVPNAINTPAFVVKKNPHQLIYVGRLVAWKHVNEIIKAVEIARRQKPWQLLIVGDGPEKEGLQKLKKPWITFAGRLSHRDSLRAIAASQKLILYSSYEGQPHVLLEAMRYKTQIVASDIPPHRELMGKSGLLVAPHREKALAAAINAPVNKEWLVRDQQQGRNYSWPNHIRLLLEKLDTKTHVLAISLDTSLLTQSYGAARARQQQYADKLGSYTLIVLNRGSHHLTPYHHRNLHIIPTNSLTRMHQLSDALYHAWKIINHQPINVITAQDPLLTGLVAWIIKLVARIPLNIQLHGAFRYGLLTPFVQFLLSQAKSIRAVDAEVVTKMRQQFPLKRSYIRHIPIGTDVSYFFRPITNKNRLLNFIAVGRLEKEKNYPMVLSAMADLIKKHHTISLTIVGNGSQEQLLKNLTHTLHLDKFVSFVGGLKLPQLRQKLHQADVFVFPSDHEGWGMVLVEAAAAGLPIVTTKVGLVGQVLMPQKHVKAVSARKITQFTTAMEWVLTHSEEAQNMAKAAQKQVQTIYTQEQTALQWVELLKDTKNYET